MREVGSRADSNVSGHLHEMVLPLGSIIHHADHTFGLHSIVWVIRAWTHLLADVCKLGHFGDKDLVTLVLHWADNGVEELVSLVLLVDIVLQDRSQVPRRNRRNADIGKLVLALDGVKGIVTCLRCA